MAFTPKTEYKDIKDISLVDFLDVPAEQVVVAHDIWKDKATVVIVIRRPGCQFCREEAKIFDGHRSTIEQSMGMKMVCIVHEKEGSDIFQKEFWHGKVYHDPTKGFYKALGGGRLRVGGWGQLIRPSFWVNLVRNKRSGVKGNFEGDGSILGGLYIVHAGDQGIAYEHIEKVWGDIASAPKVLEACSRVSGVAVNAAALTKATEEHENLHERMANSSIAQAKRASAAQDVLDATPSTASTQPPTL
ncbi:hypothetical protein BGZ93_002494 [Podila epicladia]|nr:hypothetical protein BGZ92_000335 [Podila epicladia]KAG0082319.1 hypothetical protein BGZ93_002494 [Podila epicladia]